MKNGFQNMRRKRKIMNVKKKKKNGYQKRITKLFLCKRRIGENDDEICKLIQKDLIDEFITYVYMK